MLGKCSTPELHPSETHAVHLTFGDQRRSQPTSQALSPGSGISVRMQMEDQREQSLDVVPYGSLLLRDPLLLSRAILARISGKEEAKSSLSKSLHSSLPGHFFFSQNTQSEEEADKQMEKVYQSRGEDVEGMDNDEEAQFQMLMDRLGAQKVLEE